MKRLTDEYIATGEPVWNIDELKDSLLHSSGGKCAYCECKLSLESKYVEVEHFLCKSGHPSRVLEWANLLPACKRCNGTKGDHDVALDPILDPYSDRPSDHLSFRLYRFTGVTPLGRQTLDVLGLNDPDRLIAVRFQIGEWITEAIETASDRLKTFAATPTTRSRNRLVSYLRSILVECLPGAPYAATASTVLHTAADYANIRSEMQNLGVWDDDCEQMHLASLSLALPQH